MTIVISPAHRADARRGSSVLTIAAEAPHSSAAPDDAVFARVESGQNRLLYLSSEKLLNEQIRKLLQTRPSTTPWAVRACKQQIYTSQSTSVFVSLVLNCTHQRFHLSLMLVSAAVNPTP